MIAGTEWPDLTLVRRRDRRLIFAALLPDRASRLSQRRRLVMDLLGSLAWDPALVEQERAEAVLGRPVPCIQTFVWRPSDLAAGTIDGVLR